MSKTELTEELIEELDNEIPRLAGEAFREAFERAVSQRPYVLVVKDDDLVKMDKHGNTIFVKHLPKKKTLSELQELVRTKRKTG